MGQPFFKGLPPNSFSAYASLPARVDNGSESELEAFQLELKSMTAAEFEFLEDRVLSRAENANILLQVSKSFGTTPDFSSQQFQKFFNRVCLSYDKGHLDKDQFQELAVKLIDGARFFKRSAERSTVYILRQCLTSSFPLGSMKEKMADTPLIDLAIARAIEKGAHRPFFTQGTDHVIDLFQSLSLPKALGSYAKSYLAIDEGAPVNTLLFKLFTSSKLSNEHLETLCQVMDVDLLLEKCRTTAYTSGTVASVTTAMEFFSEAEMLPDDFLARMKSDIALGKLPAYVEFIGDTQFKPEKMGRLVAFALDNLDAIYTCVKPGRIWLRSALVDLAATGDKGIEVLSLEQKIWRSEVEFDAKQPVSALLSFMRTIRDHTSEYDSAIHKISKVGLITAEPLLVGVNSGVIADVLEVSMPTNAEKKAIMKLYPQARGAMIEADLGL